MSISIPKIRVRPVAGEAYVIGGADVIHRRDPDSGILLQDTVSETYSVCVDDRSMIDTGLDLGRYETLEQAQAVADAWNSADGEDHDEDHEHEAPSPSL